MRVRNSESYQTTNLCDQLVNYLKMSAELSVFSSSEDSDRVPIYNNDNTSKETKVGNPDVNIVIEEISKRRSYAIVVLLILINVLNYMDRLTLSGLSLSSAIKSLKEYHYIFKTIKEGLNCVIHRHRAFNMTFLY